MKSGTKGSLPLYIKAAKNHVCCDTCRSNFIFLVFQYLLVQEPQKYIVQKNVNCLTITNISLILVSIIAGTSKTDFSFIIVQIALDSKYLITQRYRLGLVPFYIYTYVHTISISNNEHSCHFFFAFKLGQLKFKKLIICNS